MNEGAVRKRGRMRNRLDPWSKVSNSIAINSNKFIDMIASSMDRLYIIAYVYGILLLACASLLRL